jgi:tetratricopeptide (TPR) repeat protein
MLAAGVIVLSAVAAYHNSFSGPFVYDDLKSIVENRTIRRLWPIGPVLSPPWNGETVGGRPLLNLSLAINYAISGLDVWSYHVTNLAIHAAAALLLFGILRRTFLLGNKTGSGVFCAKPGTDRRLVAGLAAERHPTPFPLRFAKAATPLALAGALLWAVHPVQTESVTYVVQRAESLAGFFYLLTVYCVIRGAAGTVPFFATRKPATGNDIAGEKGDCPPWSWGWYAAAVLACLLGTACKEVLVTAPLIVLLYDRTFLAGSFAAAARRRWGLYLGLAATWGLLAYLVFSTGLIHRQSEMGAPDAWSYARTQPGVILHYLRLSVWPRPLCFDYAWPVANTLGAILPGGIVVGALLAATVWGLRGRKAWGFLGAWFLLILAPTSSVMPLGQLAFEHRMYLSLAAVVVAVVAGGYALWDWLGQRGQSPFPPAMTSGKTGLSAAKKGIVPGLDTILRWAAPVVVLVGVLAAFGWATAIRNWDYRSAVAIYQDTVHKRPDNPVAYNNLGFALAKDRRAAEAIRSYQEALRLKPDYAEAHGNLGLALADLGRSDEAIEHYQAALRLKPDFAEIHNTLAAFLARSGKTGEAIRHYNEALRLKPDYAVAHNNLGLVLAGLGKTDEAIEHYQEAQRRNPDYAEAHNNLGIVLAGLGKTDEAIEHYRQALSLKVDYVEAHNNLGNALAGLGKTDEAIEHYQQALRLRPDDAAAHNNLGIVLTAVGRWNEAIEHHQQALRLRPDYTASHYNLAGALVAAGRTTEAIEQYHEALRLQPDYAEAHNNLGNVLAARGQFSRAIEEYEQALRLKPDYIEAHNNLAASLVRVGRVAEAIEHCREALRRKPDYAQAHENLGDALAAASRWDEAVAHYREVLRWQAESALARFKLAGVLAAAGSTHESIGYYDQFLRLRPASVEALNNLAWLLATHEPAEGGDPSRAVRLAERARELSRAESAQCLDTLAAAYAAAGRFGDALPAAQRAAQLAESTGQVALTNNIRSRLALYRAGRPYREASQSPKQTNP